MKFFNKIPAIGTAICLGALMCFSSCTDESDDPVTETEIEIEEEEEEEVITKGTRLDTSDPNIVSDNLNISGASKEAGDMPASSDNGVLELVLRPSGNYDKHVGIPGGQLYIDLEYADFGGSQLDATEGVYLQVNGADTYWDIPTSALLQNEPDEQFKWLSIPLPFPSNLDSGQICMNYAVYDGAENVSNFMEICIDIQCEAGGNNAAFLYQVEEWEMISLEFIDGVDNPDNYSILFGEQVEDTIRTSVFCTNTGEDVRESVIRDIVERGYMTFKQDGSLEYSFVEEGQWVFENTNTDCSISELKQNVYRVEGSWSYYSTDPDTPGFIVPNKESSLWKSDTQDYGETEYVSHSYSVGFYAFSIISYEDGILTVTLEDKNSYTFDNEISTIKLRAKQ